MGKPGRHHLHQMISTGRERDTLSRQWHSCRGWVSWHWSWENIKQAPILEMGLQFLSVWRSRKVKDKLRKCSRLRLNDPTTEYKMWFCMGPFRVSLEQPGAHSRTGRECRRVRCSSVPVPPPPAPVLRLQHAQGKVPRAGDSALKQSQSRVRSVAASGWQRTLTWSGQGFLYFQLLYNCFKIKNNTPLEKKKKNNSESSRKKTVRFKWN